MSYTNFDYRWTKQPVVITDGVLFSVRIKNAGKYDGDEVVQVYLQYPQLPAIPVKELKSFKRLSLKINEEGTANFSVPLAELQKWDSGNHQRKLYAGNYKIVIGSNS